MEKSQTKHRGFSLKASGAIMAISAFIISVLLIGSLFIVASKFNRMHESVHDYINEWTSSVSKVQEASDYLTDEVRLYVSTKEKVHLDNYFNEAKVTKRREAAIEEISGYFNDSTIIEKLREAVSHSVDLMNEEYAAMRIIVELSDNANLSSYPEEIQNINVSAYVENYVSLSEGEKEMAAYNLVIDENYHSKKEHIAEDVSAALAELDDYMKKHVHDTATETKVMLFVQQLLVGLNVLFLAGIIVIIFFYVVKPIERAVDNLSSGERVSIRGAKEYRYLADTYNKIHDQNVHNEEKLHYEAEHDRLTGLYNRAGYDKVYGNTQLDKSVYILLDIDKFKSINDQKGHAVGDNVLIRVSKAISESFDSDNSSVFRLGGDEFSVIIEGVSQEQSQKLIEKCHKINAELKQEKGNSPSVSLSIGIAFGDANDTTDTLFKKADIALYNTKRNGRANACVYNKNLKMEQD